MNIACEVLGAVVGGEVRKGFGSNARKVQFVITDGEDVVVDLFENGIRNEAVNHGGIGETSAIVKIT